MEHHYPAIEEKKSWDFAKKVPVLTDPPCVVSDQIHSDWLITCSDINNVTIIYHIVPVSAGSRL